ncbi:MAG: AlwI family type II restriction endonuclease, partial [Nanoarchaeota archaeon]
PDEFLRKMKLTGLITIRGFGKFIDLNTKEIKKIDYAIKNYSKYKKYKTEREYFNYVSLIDKNLVSLEVRPIVNITLERKFLTKWAEYYKWAKVKDELLKLSSNQSSKDEILRFIPAPLRLEFLSSLAIVLKYPKVIIKPNYISDDEGLPSSHAIGGKPDIECEEFKKYVLVEVTMLTGTQQTIREMPSISRHLKDKIEQNQEAISFFVAPIVHHDTKQYSGYLEDKEKLKIFPFSIKEFLENLENKGTLYIK